MSDVIAWIDTETTGLNPEHEQLLEIACIMTDWDLNEYDSTYHAVVKYSENTAMGLRNRVNDHVREMHDRTGLWNELYGPKAKSLSEIDLELEIFMRLVSNAPGSVRMGGNSVRLDMNFCEKYLPKTYAHLHYRVVDMSTLQEVATQWFEVPTFEKKLNHSALDDIRESIDQARYLRARLS